MQNNKLLIQAMGLLFLAWFLYELLPYVIAALSIVGVVLVIAKIQNK